MTIQTLGRGQPPTEWTRADENNLPEFGKPLYLVREGDPKVWVVCLWYDGAADKRVSWSEVNGLIFTVRTTDRWALVDMPAHPGPLKRD